MGANEMSFKSGESGNPTGSNNKNRVKKQLETLLIKTIPVIEKEMATATPEARRSFFIGLSNVVFPSKRLPEINKSLKKIRTQC